MTVARLACTLACALTVGARPTVLAQGERIPLPEALPSHPRLLLNAQEIDDLRGERKTDPWARQLIDSIIASAEDWDGEALPLTPGERHHAFASKARDLALAYQFTRERRFAALAADILLAYADLAPTLKRGSAAGILTERTLEEAHPMLDLCWAYDLIVPSGTLRNEQREHVEDDLLKRIAWEAGHNCHHLNSSNWRTWAMVILAAGGFATGAQSLIDEAINGVYDEDREAYLYGYAQQIAHSFFADGTFWEGQIGYTYYTLTGLTLIADMAKHSGVDLWTVELPGLRERPAGGMHDDFGPPGPRSLRYALEALFYRAFPNMSCARVGDSGTTSITAPVRVFEAAYRYLPDPKYAWLIRRSRKASSPVPAGWWLWRANGRMAAGPDSEVARTGRGSFRFGSEAPSNRAALCQDVTVEGGKRYRFTVWAKTQNVEGGACHVRLNFGQKAVFTNKLAGTSDWTQLRCEFEAPADATRVRIHCFLDHASGTCWLDDASLVEIGKQQNLIVSPGLDSGTDTQGRGNGLWDLLYAVRNLPEGHFSFGDDADIGLSGRHRNGCTLFPDGGYALLRGNGDDIDATCLEMHYGPYGSGHDHPDKLHVTLYGRGGICAPDAGSWGYSNPMHLSWANQTIAHNTVTVDELSQYPQGNSKSIWAGERDGRLSVGKLVFFHPGEILKAVRATCDNVYEGCVLDRTLVLLDPFLIDVFRVTCDTERQIDWAWHAYGEATSEVPLEPQRGALGEARGYMHLENPRSGQSPESWDVRWTDGGRSLRMLQLPVSDSTLVVLADEPSKDRKRTAAVARRKAKATTFVTVFEPFAEEPRLRQVRELTELAPGAVGLELTHVDGTDTLLIADQPETLKHGSLNGEGYVVWGRHSREGATVATEVVPAETELPAIAVATP